MLLSNTKRVPGAHRRAPSWPNHIAILNDHVHVPYANGSSFASQFLFREFSRRGHAVTIVGPNDPKAKEADLPARRVLMPSLPLRNHPGVFMPMPSPRALDRAARQHFDVMLGQSTSELLSLGVWLRRTRHIPLLCVNTLHLPSVYNVVLPDSLSESRVVNAIFQQRIMPSLEARTASVYNDSDGLIVLSEGLEQYWRDRGVTVPIYVIPRAVDPSIFDAPITRDPFPAQAPRGRRLLCVCRHTREKGLRRLLEIFAQSIVPALPDATLTLVGDGPDHEEFQTIAARLGVAGRVFFVGEQTLTEINQWYRHADVFVYTSLSETYGQVISEASWCGLPVVALADGMGVSHQIRAGVNGALVPASGDLEKDNWRFAQEVVSLLRDGGRRRALARTARQLAKERSDPSRCIARYYEAFGAAREHCDSQARAGNVPASATGSLVRWAAMHSLVVGLGLLRPPALVNRHGKKQPSWTVGSSQTPDPGPSAGSELRVLEAGA